MLFFWSVSMPIRKKLECFWESSSRCRRFSSHHAAFCYTHMVKAHAHRKAQQMRWLQYFQIEVVGLLGWMKIASSGFPLARAWEKKKMAKLLFFPLFEAGQGVHVVSEWYKSGLVWRYWISIKLTRGDLLKHVLPCVFPCACYARSNSIFFLTPSGIALTISSTSTRTCLWILGMCSFHSDSNKCFGSVVGL